MTFRIRHLVHGWFWELIFTNGKVAASSDDFYPTEGHAIRAAKRVVKAMSGDMWHIEAPSSSQVGWWGP